MNSSTDLNAANRAGRASRSRARALGATGVLAAGGAGALLAAFAGSASAVTTINVDSAADGPGIAGHCTDGIVGNCTLRDASLAAVDGDTITFDAGITSITLTGGTVNLNAINVVGNGSANLAITTTAAPDSYDVFYITGTGDSVISGLSLSRNRIRFYNVGDARVDDVTISGSGGSCGGALYANNDGDFEIVNSFFESNYSALGGGAVCTQNSGSVTITGSSFTSNSSAGDGGALFTGYDGTGTISISGSDFTSNYSASSSGAAEFNSAGSANVIISDSMFTDNDTAGWAGAFYVMSSIVDVTINGTVVSGSYSGDGAGVAYIENSGNLTITNSTLENNTTGGGSGALYLHVGGDATITNTLISGNVSMDVHGGGITNAVVGVLTINNSTLTGNSGLSGGAIFNDSSLVINQSTITTNTASVDGGGVLVAAGSSFEVSGTIVSGNSSSGDADIATDTNNPFAITVNYSLIGDIDSALTVNGSNNISSTNPMVGALADNGGPTKTMALLDGSPAIDAGPDPVATFVGNDSDQRGLPWVRVFGGMVDIGAFEVQPDPYAPTTTTTAVDPGETTTTAGTDPVIPVFTG